MDTPGPAETAARTPQPRRWLTAASPVACSPILGPGTCDMGVLLGSQDIPGATVTSVLSEGLRGHALSHELHGSAVSRVPPTHGPTGV